MQNARSLNPSIPAKDRLSLRFGLLFVATFLAVLILLMAWTLLATIGDRQRSAANSDIAAPVIVIDPKIQTELAKALAFDAIPATAEVLNPFIDRAGIGGNVAITAASAAAKAASVPSTSRTNAATTGTASGTTVTQVPAASSVDPNGTKARHDDWLSRQRRGEFVVPVSEVLSVDDLVPVGYASGGNSAPEVLLYSPSLCKTFSLAAGARFFDGWLNAFNQDEVVFVFGNGIRRKSFARPDPCPSEIDNRAGDANVQPAVNSTGSLE
jgi:hypothetical protein